jgi:hypothetical protein
LRRTWQAAFRVKPVKNRWNKKNHHLLCFVKVLPPGGTFLCMIIILHKYFFLLQMVQNGVFNSGFGVFNSGFEVLNSVFEVLSSVFEVFNSGFEVLNSDAGVFNPELGVLNPSVEVFNSGGGVPKVTHPKIT